MKTYQTPDVLHGHGKAVPKPKRPTTQGNRKPRNIYHRDLSRLQPCCLNGHGK